MAVVVVLPTFEITIAVIDQTGRSQVTVYNICVEKKKTTKFACVSYSSLLLLHTYVSCSEKNVRAVYFVLLYRGNSANRLCPAIIPIFVVAVFTGISAIPLNENETQYTTWLSEIRKTIGSSFTRTPFVCRFPEPQRTHTRIR